MFLSLALSIILSALKQSVKNPAKKEELRKAMLELRDTIDLIYGNPLAEDLREAQDEIANLRKALKR
jgi:hypothetical protein